MRFFVKLLSNLNKNINLLTFTQHKLLILKSEFIYASLIFSCKHILKSLQSSILRDTKKSTKKKMHPEKNCFLKKCKLSHLKYQTTQRSVQNCRQYRLENKIEVQCKRKKKYLKKLNKKYPGVKWQQIVMFINVLQTLLRAHREHTHFWLS